jgi:hypothetical protein
LDRSLCESPAPTADNVTAGRSGLAHRFLARACGEASAAASSGSSDTDRAWRGAWAWACKGSCCGCGTGLGVLAATSMAGRSCTRVARSLAGAAAPPVPVPRLRNGLGVAHSPNSASAPRLLRLWWCECDDDLAGLPAAPLLTVLLLGSTAASPLGVLGMDAAIVLLAWAATAIRDVAAPASCASRVVPQSARGLTGMVRTAALAPRAC